MKVLFVTLMFLTACAGSAPAPEVVTLDVNDAGSEADVAPPVVSVFDPALGAR